MDWTPNEEQATILEAVSDDPTLDTSAVCKQCSISRSTLYRWFDRDPSFKRAYLEIPKKRILAEAPEIVRGLLCRAKAGDVFAARLCFEIMAKGYGDTGVDSIRALPPAYFKKDARASD